jgi:hypothetical protein
MPAWRRVKTFSHSIRASQDSFEKALVTVNLLELIGQQFSECAQFFGFIHVLYTKAFVETWCGGREPFDLLLLGSLGFRNIFGALLLGCGTGRCGLCVNLSVLLFPYSRASTG